MSKYGCLLLLLTLPMSVSGQLLKWDLCIPGVSGTEDENRNLTEYRANSIMELYYQRIAYPKDMINGREYVPYFYRSETTPLLFSGEEMTSTLIFNGRRYENIRLLYDTYLDEFVYIDTTRMINFQYPRIVLNKDLVDEVTLDVKGQKMEFRHLRFIGGQGNNLQDGYYEIVSPGSERFIIKHRSAEYTRDAMNEYHYLPEKYFYIDGSYHNIKNLKDLLYLSGNNSPELKAYIKSAGIKVRRADKWQMAEVLKRYEALAVPDEVSK